MSELIVSGFKGEAAADKVLLDLEELQETHKVNLDDAVVAIRKADGTIRIKHSHILVLKDAAVGSTFGLVLGPLGILVGGVIGAAIGETITILRHIGIDDDFVKSVADVVTPGNSAIFVRVHKSLSEGIVNELKKFNGTLLRSTLSVKDEQGLVNALREDIPVR